MYSLAFLLNSFISLRYKSAALLLKGSLGFGSVNKELIDNTTTTTEENTTNNETSNTEPVETKQTQPSNKKGMRRVPKEKATHLDIGTKMKSETTGDMYIVASRKDGRKMWKKIEAK